MNWKAIHDLFEGFLGKSLLLVALATPMSFLVKADFNPLYYKISLVGAIVILVGYVWTVISTPMLIKNSQNGHDYAQQLISLENYIDWVSEFKVLEDNKSKLDLGYDGYFYKQFDFKDIDNAQNEVGKEASIRALSILKFNLVNKFDKCQRVALTVLFFSGALLIYIPLVYRIFIVLGVTK